MKGIKYPPSHDCGASAELEEWRLHEVMWGNRGGDSNLCNCMFRSLELWKIFEQLQVCPHYFTLSKRGGGGLIARLFVEKILPDQT